MSSLRPATIEEESLYLASQLEEGAVFANVAWVAEINGDLDRVRLSRGIASLSRAHPAIASVFCTDKDGNTLVGLNAAPVSLQIVQVSSVHSAVQRSPEDNVVRELNRLSSLPIDPRGPEPLVRFYLVNSPALPSKHWLLVNAHHAVVDGTSMRIIFEDLAAFYNQDKQEISMPRVVGTTSQDEGEKKVDVTPRLVAEREVRMRQSGAWEGELMHWRQRLAGSNGQVLMPSLGKTSPEAGPGQSSSVHFSVPEDIVKQLRGVARHTDATLFGVLVAGLTVLLNRWSGEYDVNIGTAVAGRKKTVDVADLSKHGNLDRTVACLVNMAAMRLQSSPDMQFSDLVLHAKEALIDAAQHSDVPFSLVRQQYLGGSQSPFQVSIVKQDSRLPGSFQLSGLDTRVDPLLCDVGAIQQDIIFEVIVMPRGEVSGRIRFKTKRFDIEYASSLVRQYQKILAAVGTSPTLCLKDIPLFEKEDEERFMRFSAGESRPEWNEALLAHQLFEKQAIENPNHICLRFEGDEMTYGDVNKAADAVSATLRTFGVKEGDLVGVMMERSFDLIIGIMGVMKAGAAYLPLDPSYPTDRLQIYVEDGGCSVVVTQPQLIKKAEELVGKIDCQILDVNKARAMGAQNSRTVAMEPPSRASPAYCIFTSGSTGRPKGVSVSHHALADLIAFGTEFYELGRTSTVPLTISICFDPHVLQTLVPLAAGSTVVIARPGGHLDGEYMAHLILDEQISAITAGVPTLAKEYVEAIHDYLCDASVNGAASIDTSALRWWAMGGESLNLDLVNRIESVMKSCRVVNCYGPTEVTVSCVEHVMSPKEANVVIGRPDPNVHGYIVDSNLRPSPPGAAGELLLSGPRLALGYLGREDLTAEKFITNPFLEMVEPSVESSMLSYFRKAYRTGDLVRWLPDGNIEFLGRIDRQVKIMGTRIELGEVEAALTSCRGVQQAVAAAMTDDHNAKRLVAYIVPESVDVPGLAAHCRSRLMTAMVPTAFVTLGALPLMANGKVDMKGLPEPDWNAAAALVSSGGTGNLSRINIANTVDVDADKVALDAMSPAEKAVAIAVQAILGRSAPPKVHVDLSLLGLNSIRAMRLVHRVNAALGASLGFRDMIETPTVEAIATKAAASGCFTEEEDKSSLMAGDGIAQNGEIQRIFDPSRECYPATSAQKRLWINAINNSGALRSTSVHNICGKAIDPERLAMAAELVSRRHVILRTCYELDDQGELLQIVDLDRKVPFRAFRAQDAEHAQQACAMFLQQPFVLDEDLPFRVLLVTYGDDDKDQLLVLDLHHICIDGWSSPILINELSKEYANTVNFSGSIPHSYLTQEIPLQYIDVATAQDVALSEAKREKQLKFWREMLSNEDGEAKLLELGDLKPRHERVGKERSNSIPIDYSLSEKLRSIIKSTGCSLHSGFMGLLQILLSIESGGIEQFNVGTVVAGRTLPESESTIGFFVNTLAIPAKVEGNKTLMDLLEEVNGMMLQCYDNADVSYTDVLAQCDGWDGSLFSVMFAMQSDWLQPFSLDGAESTALFPEGCDALFPLTIQIADCGEDVPLMADLKYDSSLFSQVRIERLAQHLINLLEQFAAQPDITVSQLDILTQEEKSLLLDSWIGRPAAWPKDRLAHEIFEQHVEVMPNHIAAWYGKQSITYAELDAKANQLARFLQSRKIGPDVMVTVMMGRCIEFLVCVLGITKAGGAYVPLDEEYPEERLQYILNDSAAPVLLTLKKLNDKASLAPRNCQVTYVDLDSWSDELERYPSSKPKCMAGPDSMVYCIYTSGTTGRPKGTMLEHRNLVAYLYSHTSWHPVYESDVFSQLATISFDASIHEYWLSFFAGGTLAIVPGKESMAPFEIFKRHGVSVSIFPTALWDVFASQTDWTDIPRLRLVAVGGDVLRKGKPRDGNFELCNSYGPTEITVMCTAYQTKFEEDAPCIGGPLPNTRCYVVDKDLRLVPVGVPGELLVGGPGVARGYHKQPAMTSQRFVQDPFCADPGAKAYKTGDVVRWRPDGTLDFVGRADSQVKIRGYRIEISEVESVLLKAPGVDEGLVVAMVDPKRGNRKILVGYAAAFSKGTGKQAPDSSSIKSFMASLLADYMVPSHIVVLPHALPRTPNGKYDRKALPPLETESRRPAAGDSEAESDEMDEHASGVLAIIREVLGFSEDEPISLDEDIFELGADSLQAAMIVSRMRKNLGVNMEMRQIYDDGSISVLIDIVRSQKSGGGKGAGGSSAAAGSGAKARRLGALGLSVSAAPASWSLWKRLVIPLVQLAASLVILLCFLGSMAPGYAVFLVLYLVKDAALWLSLFCLPAFFFCWGTTLMLVSLVLKWILIGKYKPGVHEIWGPHFVRWWIVHRVVVVCRPVLNTLPHSWLVLYYKLMGAKIDHGACIRSKSLCDFDLLSIGSDTFVGKDVTIAGHVIERGRLLLGKIVIGDACSIGMLSFISPDSTIDDNVTLAPMTLVPIGAALPPNSTWHGSPARKQPVEHIELLQSKKTARTATSRDLKSYKSFSGPATRSYSKPVRRRHGQIPSGILFFLGIVRILSAVILMGLAFYPFALSIFYAANYNISLSVLVLGFSFVGAHLLYIAIVAFLKLLVLGRARPGSYQLDSWYAQRFLLVACWLQMPFALGFCSLFSNTPILTLGLRALGARLGGSNIILNPASIVLPGVDQWDLEFGTVFGGNTVVMGYIVERDELHIGPVRIGSGCFLGDNAVVLPSATLQAGSLAGTLTLVGQGQVLNPGSVWVGSPAICLDKGTSPIPPAVSGGLDGALSRRKQSLHHLSQMLSTRRSSTIQEAKLYDDSPGYRDASTNTGMLTIAEDAPVIPTPFDVRLSATFSRQISIQPAASLGRRPSSRWMNSKHQSMRQSSMTSKKTLQRMASRATTFVDIHEESKETSALLVWGPVFVSLVLIPLYLMAVYIGPINLVFYCATNVSVGLAIGLLPIYLAMIGFATCGLLLIFKWLVIGRFRPASFSLRNAAMFFWWTSLISLTDFALFLFMGFILGTEWATWFMRAAGASIGEDTYLDGIPTVEFDLLKIGDRCTIGEGASTIGHTLENNMLNFLIINIGDDASVGSNSHVLPNSVVESRAGIGALSLVMKGEQLSEGWWEGSPVSFAGVWFDPDAEETATAAHAISEALRAEIVADAKLPPGRLFLPSGGLPGKETPPKVALLTGATGFVGAFLLRTLLEDMDIVYCLVRAGSDEEGLERIRKNLARYSLMSDEDWRARMASKVVPLLGDLGKRNLGVRPSKFEELANTVDIIYHNGAMVNMSFGYGALKPANVEGTLECLRLATMGKYAIPVHYISTEGVLPTNPAKVYDSPGIALNKKGEYVVTEKFVLDDPDTLHQVGYDQSKWVAERIVLDAATRGLPVAVYRLGRIGADSRSGASNTDDFLLLFVKGCLQMQCFPTAESFKFPVNVVPADITAQRIYDISMSRDPPASGIYHIGNPAPPSFLLVITMLREMGYQFKLLPYQMWRQRLVDCASEDNTLKPLEDSFSEGDVSFAGPSVDCSRAGIYQSPMEPESLRSCFEYLISSGYLPKP